MKKPFKILISGYYGFNNIGDDSILTSVLDSLRRRLHCIEITVLAKDPDALSAKHGVRSVNRKSFPAIIREISRTDLLISGGGSLLQDVTSKKSILYYLAIMWISYFMGKKVFIYSQGIGPINSSLNRRLTAWTLKRAAAVVVRDDASKDLLEKIGLDSVKIHVTADPVLRIKPADLSIGRNILIREGLTVMSTRERDGVYNADAMGAMDAKGAMDAMSAMDAGGAMDAISAMDAANRPMLVGMAIREPRRQSDFIDELCCCIKRLTDEHNAKVVLIPFHYSEDVPVIHEIESRVPGSVLAVKHKYLTEEMLSIIGNMDLLVGVRLHSLIYAAVMNVPMIAVSYDPKINAFMHSLEMKAMSFVNDFSCEDFMEEFAKTLKNSEIIKERILRNVERLVKKLDKNEDIIQEIIDKYSVVSQIGYI